MDCPVCLKNNTRFKFILNGYTILHCKVCDHVFTDYKPSQKEVSQIYSDDYFFKGGGGYDDYTLERDMLIKRGEYYASKLTKYISPGKVLDIGSAAGFILKGFENKGWEGIGIEPNKSMVGYGRQNLGLNIQKGTIETIELKEKFDLVLLIQVVAHIYDLNQSIHQITNFLNPGGHVLIETWDKDSWTSKIFGKHWHQYSPPSTLNFYSKKTLNYFMSQQNFSRITEGTPKKKIHSKHAKSLVKHKLSEIKGLNWLTVFLKIIPDNIMLPYPAEDLFWALYKKTE